MDDDVANDVADGLVVDVAAMIIGVRKVDFPLASTHSIWEFCTVSVRELLRSVSSHDKGRYLPISSSYKSSDMVDRRP